MAKQNTDLELTDEQKKLLAQHLNAMAELHEAKTKITRVRQSMVEAGLGGLLDRGSLERPSMNW